MDDIRYPIGRFDPQVRITAADRPALIDQIAEAPARMRSAVAGLDDAQLDTPYREGGWTLRQVVHHVPDSHLNGYIRMKWALTEDNPEIKTYAQPLWAELPDARTAPIEISLSLLDAIHARWVLLLRAMSDADYERTFRHPESGAVPQSIILGLYAWHGRHHAAHITTFRQRMGW